MKFLLPFLTLLLYSGCNHSQKNVSPKEPMQKKVIPKQNSTTQQKRLTTYLPNATNTNTFHSLNMTIINLADQLFQSNFEQKSLKIILTSFVNLNSFDKTSSIGRLLSESLYNELHIRNFRVTDFRGKNTVTVNEDGEFHITRDAEKLKNTIKGIEYIVVGTYSKFENESLLINARIIDSISGEVISSARSIYRPKNCKVFDLCEKKEPKSNATRTQYLFNTKIDENSNSTFEIIADDCRDSECKK
ncbi:MAG: hypothetical protein CSA86_03410 [Arcobacter sp.]|nr:MAG: hypothetical protein CSA86_03410 [Arcobacter sp.]